MNKPFENTFDVKYDENGIETFNRWQDPTINELQQQLDKYKNVIDKIKEYIKENSKNISITPNSVKAVPVEYILELLEEVE